MPDPITRETLLRIVLAISGNHVDFLSPTELDQVGASENAVSVAVEDQREISRRYEQNKGRAASGYMLTFSTSAILARLEWAAELLGVEMPKGDTADA